jgi:hypothetical protein
MYSKTLYFYLDLVASTGRVIAGRQVPSRRIYSTSTALLCSCRHRTWPVLHPATAFTIFTSNISANLASYLPNSILPSPPTRPTNASLAPDCHLSLASQSTDSVTLDCCPSLTRDYSLHCPSTLRNPPSVSFPSRYRSVFHSHPVFLLGSNLLLSPHQQGTRLSSLCCLISTSSLRSAPSSVVWIAATARGRVGSKSV